MERTCIYGPVASRRFGLSLGVDLLPGKVCSYNCVYCQVGETEELTAKRRDFFSLENILRQVKEALEQGPEPDVITLAGSGEPTLYRSLGPLITELKRLAHKPVLLITNGSLFHDEDVVGAALLADIVAPSLDAPDEKTFLAINRPSADVTFDRMVHGLERFCARYQGECRLEVMLVDGINTSTEQLEAFRRLLDRMACSKIDVNTPIRPGWNKAVGPCDEPLLEQACGIFGPRAGIIASFPGSWRESYDRQTAVERIEARILALLARRPCTIPDLATSLVLDRQVIEEAVRSMVSRGRIEARPGIGEPYFTATTEGRST